MPKTLALMAVHRQTAASRSAKPSMRVQHGVLGGVSMVRPSNPPSKFAHTPNFKKYSRVISSQNKMFSSTKLSKVSESGTSRLMPKILALRAVQRQMAASRSAKPSMRVQHGVLGGVPMLILRRPLSKSAHTPSFRVSLGHDLLLGFGLGGVHAQTMVNNKMLIKKNNASGDDVLVLDAIVLRC
ncbi:hypothetical protein ACJIZ3_004110 [Penstemon smallii]|uniref:Uncharacterized protein n=1 Tax=Penstemon smallii TaxID=265156 RepID=A0ABD3S146_9LAMI